MLVQFLVLSLNCLLLFLTIVATTNKWKQSFDQLLQPAVHWPLNETSSEDSFLEGEMWREKRFKRRKEQGLG